MRNYKTFTKKQAIEFINKTFMGNTIIQIYDDAKELSVIFKDGTGKVLELYTSADVYFQKKGNEFIIVE